MRTIIFVFIALFSSSHAVAGDGGFFLQTCLSSSGRTNLTIYQDYFSGAKSPVKVVLGIDGQFITYAPETESCTGSDGQVVGHTCLTIIAEPQLVVSQGKGTLLRVNFGDSLTATIEKGFFDPRSMEINDHTEQINLKCKEYEAQP